MSESPDYPPPAARRRSRLVLIALGVAGAAALAVGLVLVLSPIGTTSFGWFAYGPISDVTFSPDGAFLTAQGQLGIALGAAGLAIIAFCVGWAFGSRHASR